MARIEESLREKIREAARSKAEETKLLRVLRKLMQRKGEGTSLELMARRRRITVSVMCSDDGRVCFICVYQDGRLQYCDIIIN